MDVRVGGFGGYYGEEGGLMVGAGKLLISSRVSSGVTGHGACRVAEFGHEEGFSGQVSVR